MEPPAAEDRTKESLFLKKGVISAALHFHFSSRKSNTLAASTHFNGIFFACVRSLPKRNLNLLGWKSLPRGLRMCGIVGYTGKREAGPILLEGLARLEYRGYDSAGMATVSGANMRLRKCAGRIANLASLLERQPAPGFSGISHTRWATHGSATDANAHPHLGGDGAVAVVHNGVIENYTFSSVSSRSAAISFAAKPTPKSSPTLSPLISRMT